MREEAICSRGGGSMVPLLSLGRWYRKTTERLKRLERIFCNLHEHGRELGCERRNEVVKSLNEIRSELRRNYVRWVKSKFRQQLIERREAKWFVKEMDALLSDAINDEGNDIERKYQKALSIINRNRR